MATQYTVKTYIKEYTEDREEIKKYMQIEHTLSGHSGV